MSTRRKPTAPTASLVLTAMLVSSFGAVATAKTLRVPADFSTIQAAIDAAAEGDTVLVAPGVYHETLRIDGKAIRLVSRFSQSGDANDITVTVLSGEAPEAESEGGRRPVIVSVGPDVGEGCVIEGFLVVGGDDGVVAESRVTIRHNRFVDNSDAIDYEGGGGLCAHNHFEHNRDDGIDCDLACDVVIEHNTIVRNRDDGIEIRLHPHGGDPVKVVVRNNVIVGNGEDGVQLIDYAGASNRSIVIRGNLIASSLMAGVGFMADANTREDFSAAAIPERVKIIDNTFVENRYGVTASGNVRVRGNTFVRHDAVAVLTAADEGDLARKNLFWANRTDVGAPASPGAPQASVR